MTADVLVCGGGPAGAAAAVALARGGAAVVVLERSRYAADRVGDTLAPAAGRWLAALGVDPADVPGVPSPGVLSAWDSAAPVATDFLFTADGDGRHVDRSALDAAAAAAAERAGAVVVRGAAVTAARRTAGRWRVTAGGAEYAAGWLIDAAGRTPRVARPIPLDRQVAVVARLTGVTTPDRRLRVEAAADGWWYFAPLPGGRGVLAWLTDADLLPVFPALAAGWADRLARTDLVRAAAAGATAGPVRVVRAGMTAAAAVVGDGWLAAGDAASAHDPLSGSGVTAALAGGWAAGTAVLAGPAGCAEYQRQATADIRARTADRAALYARAARWPGQPYWDRRTDLVPRENRFSRIVSDSGHSLR